MFNPQFGSVFRTYHNASYFSRRLNRFADVYMSSIENLFHYHCIYKFVVSRGCPITSHRRWVVKRKKSAPITNQESVQPTVRFCVPYISQCLVFLATSQQICRCLYVLYREPLPLPAELYVLSAQDCSTTWTGFPFRVIVIFFWTHSLPLPCEMCQHRQTVPYWYMPAWTNCTEIHKLPAHNLPI